MLPRTTLVIFLAIGTACGSARPRAEPVVEPQGDAGAAPSAEGALAALEERLLGAASVRLHATIASEGAIESELSGTMLLASGGRAAVDFTGTFGGEAASPHLISDGSIQRGGQQHEPFAEATPDHLHEGLLVGLVRMGLLHNLAALCAGEPPDRTDGTVREWVTVSEAAWGEPGEVGGVAARPLAFAITVSGREAAEAALWIGGESGLPVERWQTVQLEEGEMRVVERYEELALDVEVDAAAFDIMAGLPEE